MWYVKCFILMKFHYGYVPGSDGTGKDILVSMSR